MELMIVTPAAVLRAASEVVGAGPRLLRLLGDVEDLVPRIAGLIAAIEQIATAAGGVVEAAERVVGSSAGVVSDAAPVITRTAQLVDELGPALRKLQPTLETLADSTSPEEVEALVGLVDQLPELTASLRDDVLPIMRTMDHVSDDLHDLMLLSRELNEMLSNVPGVRRLLSREVGSR